jgi:seryl-tRNA synthetase
MIDVQLIRNNTDLVRLNIKRRKEEKYIKTLDEFIETDRNWRSLQTQINELRRKRNKLSSEISNLKKQSLNVNLFLRKAEILQKEIKKLNFQVENEKKKSIALLMQIPNMLHKSVPRGENEHDNVEIRRWGKAPEFNFVPKNHYEIALNLGLLDEKRAHKVAGAGFFYLKNNLALLDISIQRYAIDLLMSHGYTLIEPPFMLRRKPYEGVTDLSDFEMVMYKIENEDHYLIATSEHPIAAMFMNETLLESNLPKKFVGMSTNFRKEIGTHGKYTKGLFRVHQFNKIEQFIFCLPEDSWKYHKELQKNCEELYQNLKLHYRVVDVCTGDIGIVPARKYDTEIWMADGKFREAGSNSNCTSYQSRRLGIKFREEQGKPPKEYVHTLNSTALATSRTMMAILEQYQKEDGSVTIPEVLRPYMNNIDKISVSI